MNERAEVANELRDYYGSVSPFYEAEMQLRDDLADWERLLATSGARTAVDLGCGGGRVTRLLAARGRAVGVDLQTKLLPEEPGFDFVQADMRALPFGARRFDLAIAANDPFAHLLRDDERTKAVDEATRVAARLVVEGLALTPADREQARSGLLVREAVLADGTRRHEIWRTLGEHLYRTTYRYLRRDTLVAEATTDVRAWSRDERALRDREVHVAGGLDGRPYDAHAPRIVVVIGKPLWA